MMIGAVKCPLDIYRSLAALFTIWSMTRRLTWDGSEQCRHIKHGFGSHTGTAHRKIILTWMSDRD